MAIAARFITVVIRKSSLEAKYPGGIAQFRADCPYSAEDDYLSREGFMNPMEVESFIGEMERKGLTFLDQGRAIDLVVVDMLGGPTTPCDWIEFGYVNDQSCCWLRGTPPGNIVL